MGVDLVDLLDQLGRVTVEDLQRQLAALKTERDAVDRKIRLIGTALRAATRRQRLTAAVPPSTAPPRQPDPTSLPVCDPLVPDYEVLSVVAAGGETVSVNLSPKPPLPMFRDVVIASQPGRKPAPSVPSSPLANRIVGVLQVSSPAAVADIAADLKLDTGTVAECLVAYGMRFEPVGQGCWRLRRHNGKSKN